MYIEHDYDEQMLHAEQTDAATEQFTRKSWWKNSSMFLFMARKNVHNLRNGIDLTYTSTDPKKILTSIKE